MDGISLVVGRYEIQRYMVYCLSISGTNIYQWLNSVKILISYYMSS